MNSPTVLLQKFFADLPNFTTKILSFMVHSNITSYSCRELQMVATYPARYLPIHQDYSVHVIGAYHK